MTFDIEWRILNDTGNETLVTGLTDPEYTLTGIDTATTRYELRARAVDGAETSDWSGWVASGLLPLDVPDNVELNPTSETELRLSWGSAGAGLNYDVELEKWDAGEQTYATWDPDNKHSAITLSNGNLTATHDGGITYPSVRSTVGVSSGRYYWELTHNAGGLNFIGVGTSSAALSAYIGFDAHGFAYYQAGTKLTNNVSSVYGDLWTTNDIIGVALDLDNGKVWFSKNGTWQASGDPAAGTGEAFSGLSGEFFAYISLYVQNNQITANFGQSAFSHTVPTGFEAGLYEDSSGWVADESASDIDALFYDFTDLDPDTLYRARVRSRNSEQQSDWSEWFEATTTDTGAVSGTLAAQELGHDAVLIEAATVTSAELSAQETGDDTATLTATSSIDAALSAQEVGDDTVAISAGVDDTISGSLAAAEIGNDTAAITATNSVSAELSAQETGTDTAAITGFVSEPDTVSGVLQAQETGDDTAALSGLIIVSAAFAAQEAGQDSVGITGAVALTATLAAAEIGDDTVFITGDAIQPGAILGTLTAQEMGSDAASFSASVAVSTDLAAQEAGQDDASAFATSTVAAFLAAQETGQDQASMRELPLVLIEGFGKLSTSSQTGVLSTLSQTSVLSTLSQTNDLSTLSKTNVLSTRSYQ